MVIPLTRDWFFPDTLRVPPVITVALKELAGEVSRVAMTVRGSFTSSTLLT